MVKAKSSVTLCAFLCFLTAVSLRAQWVPDNPVASATKEADGVLFQMKTGTLKLAVCTGSIVHVIYSPSWPLPKRPDFVITKTTWTPVEWSMEQDDRAVTLKTARLQLSVLKKDGMLSYRDGAGKPLLAEGPRLITPVVVNDEQTYHAADVIKIYGSDEAFYGLGQHQAGVWNYRGESVELSQENTNIAIPFFLSSKGYGIYWNNNSPSRFNNRFIHYLYLSSEVADAVDYYFFYGPEFDKIIAGYRELTGGTPLFGKWAYGYWQSKNKYASQEELLGIAKKYRDLKIPIDNIVQDWFWWTTTGEFKFNSKYPDPKAMVDELHREHFHLMMSVWPFFDPGTETYADMDKRGYFVARTPEAAFHPKGAALYDAFNPEARKYYWNLINGALFGIGADAWWLDTTEPETEGTEENILLSNKVALGSGARYANTYPLMTTMGVYENQRATNDQKRVFILSRSAYSGNQRFGVTAWSGDILSDFETYKRQIPAGLNFELSGIPYWTTDIGGFILGHPRDEKYRELFVRWFQYGTFCPIFRVHGTRAPSENELWSYGPDAQAILTKFDRLRYRLMPYIYSMAWKITSESYTPMRPLVMDFAEDTQVRNIGDQFMFGPALLVNPVTEQGATSRRMYLPQGKWFDFWTGAEQRGGASIDAPAPLDKLPLYVRAGSIVPLGPDVQYAAEKAADPIELRVYPGADADYTLYEDENDTYNYEKGVYATIPIHWSDANHTLTISERKGSFPGMLKARTFQVTVVTTGRGAGVEPSGQEGKTVQYDGKSVSVSQND